MKTITVLILLLILTSCSTPNKILIKDIEKHSMKEDSKDSILLHMQKKYDLVFGYVRQGTAWNHGSFFYLFALKAKHWTAYKYTKKTYASIGGKFWELDSFNVSKMAGDSTFSNFKKKRTWEIRTHQQPDNSECPNIDYSKGVLCSISDADEECLIIMTKTHYNTMCFYAPQFYEYKCCPGWVDRQKYLETMAPIWLFFKGR